MKDKMTITEIRPGAESFTEFRGRILYARVVKGDEVFCLATLEFILQVYFDRQEKVTNYWEALKKYIDFNNRLVHITHKDKLIPLLTECVSSVWIAETFTEAQKLYDEFLQRNNLTGSTKEEFNERNIYLKTSEEKLSDFYKERKEKKTRQDATDELDILAKQGIINVSSYLIILKAI